MGRDNLDEGVGDQIAHAFLARRALAFQSAKAYLASAGFVQAAERIWDGRLAVTRESDQQTVEFAIAVALPEEFPDKLPAIYMKEGQLPVVFPHVEESGKICIAPTTNISADLRQPDAVIEAALKRAKTILAAGFSDIGDRDVAREFLAYWKADKPELFWSICSSRGSSRPVFAGFVQRVAQPDWRRLLISDSRGQAEEWAVRAHVRLTNDVTNAFLLPLSEAAQPPGFKNTLTVADWLERLRSKATPADWQAFEAWLDRERLPGILAFSMPSPESALPALAAVLLPRLNKEDLKAVQRGFRPGHVTARMGLAYAGKYPLQKVAPVRLDSEYLRLRGGGLLLSEQAVTVVGCGSVGSFLAFNLASLGAGLIRLVDPAHMGAENVHRHFLGVSDVGSQKAMALARSLERHFPHQAVEWRAKAVEELLTSEADFLLGADLIVIAIGEETLERHLNEALGTAVLRLHTWLEPLGVGGHVLLTGKKSTRGCYECLFSNGPSNDASLCAPDQDIARTLAGCAGTFSPFSGLDATRTALEAARLATSALLAREPQSVLLTWRGELGEFEQSGYRLSDRGQRLVPGSVLRQTAFARADCPTCRTWLG